MLAKLHCNEFSSEKLCDALDATRSELEEAETELESVTDQLTTGRQRSQQLHADLHDAQDILYQQVSQLGMFSTGS